MSKILRMWTVYEHPSDFPDKFVARMFVVDENGARATASVIIAADIETLRDILAFEMSLVPISRAVLDDPVIVETWL